MLIHRRSLIPTGRREAAGRKGDLGEGLAIAASGPNRVNAGCCRSQWLRGRDLNPRPLGYEPNELPDCSTPRQKKENTTFRSRMGIPGSLPREVSVRFSAFFAIRVAFSLTLLLSTAAPAFSQAAPPPPPPRQEGTAELAFVGTSGNASTSAFSAGGEHIFRPDTWLLKHRVAFIRNSAEDVVTAESFLYVLSRRARDQRQVSAFGEYAYFSDEFAGVDHRNGLLGGIAYKVVDTAAHRLTVDAGLGYLNEQRLDRRQHLERDLRFRQQLSLDDLADGDDSRTTRGSRARSTTREDWRFLHVISLTSRLTQILSLKVSNTIRYANFPPPGFKTTDTTTSIALVAKFSKP